MKFSLTTEEDHFDPDIFSTLVTPQMYQGFESEGVDYRPTVLESNQDGMETTLTREPIAQVITAKRPPYSIDSLVFDEAQKYQADSTGPHADLPGGSVENEVKPPKQLMLALPYR